MIAANVMITDVITLKSNDTMVDAIKIVRDRKIRQIPVVDNEKRVIGIITPRALMRAILPKYIDEGLLEDVKFAPELPQFIQSIDDLAHKKVSEFMDTDFPKVTPDVTTMEVAAMFIVSKKIVESIVVVDDDNRLLGIISPWDIFKRVCEYSEKNRKTV